MPVSPWDSSQNRSLASTGIVDEVLPPVEEGPSCGGAYLAGAVRFLGSLVGWL